MLIRRIDPQEADALTQIALAAKAHWGYPQQWMQKWAPELTFTPENFLFNENWVVVEDGVPIGFYTLEERDGVAWLDDLWVKPEFMGRGVGKRLFLHALEIARQRDCQRLQLEADPNAVGFYERMGMHRIGERHYEIESQPRILPIMEIEL